MMRKFAVLLFFLSMCVLGFAEKTREKDYILVLNSINFNEVWANNLYRNIREKFSSSGLRVEAEELSIPMITRVEEMEEKRKSLYRIFT